MSGAPETSRPSGEEILYLGGGEWNACPRGTDFLRVLSRWGNRAIVVESPGMRAPSFSLSDARRVAARARRILAPRREPEPGIEVFSPPTLPYPSSKLVRAANGALQLLWIRRALARNRFGPRPWLWLSSPIFAGLVPRIDHSLLLYDCFDEWTAFPGVDAALFDGLERHLIAMSDVVTVASEGLLEAKKRQRADLCLVPNGVDVERFAGPRPDPPDEMRALVRPIVGYSGNIYQRLDFDLLRRLALSRPRWSFVFVGLVRCDLGGLDRLPNVRFLGLKPWEELPRTIRSFDVGIIPHRIERLTELQNPTKLYEYMASGLPVVASDLPELRAFGDLVRIAARPEGFAAGIEAALGETGEEASARRRTEARKHTWENRVERIVRAVESARERFEKRAPR